MNDENFTSRVRIQVLLNKLREENKHLLTLEKKALTSMASEKLMKISILDKLVAEKTNKELDDLWAEVINEE